MRRGDPVDGERPDDGGMEGRAIIEAVNATRLDIGAHGPQPAFSDNIETPLPLSSLRAESGFTSIPHPEIPVAIRRYSGGGLLMFSKAIARWRCHASLWYRYSRISHCGFMFPMNIHVGIESVGPFQQAITHKQPVHSTELQGREMYGPIATSGTREESLPVGLGGRHSLCVEKERRTKRDAEARKGVEYRVLEVAYVDI
ncbi:hypothetical protein FA13DRAFT_1717326 [Coprinellus micaceus]|uniref:Uncharacterized protein n=1 Tax=Coprinellus micaceus TaxID=71717 RepID=A0A4Y7SGY5_COPMI|nr:hypothetical protein FA13DRAFT_1717326 [Coprinellus micaceus]